MLFSPPIPFKTHIVETIGDCYMAATGLPEPREEYVQSKKSQYPDSQSKPL